MSGINQAERARLAWDELISVASTRSTTTYGQLGSAIGVHHRAIRYVLSLLQDYCIEARLPPLTILVVNATGRPGTGFIAYDLEDFDQGLELVWGRDWKAVSNPFTFASDGTSYKQLVTVLAHDPDNAKDVYALVKSRGVRHLLFRDALRRVYGRRCAFTGVSIEEALEASHIISWSHATPAQQMDVRNGLLLNSFHHRLFDCAYLTITQDLVIQYCDPKGSEWKHNKIERSLTMAFHGKAMRIPRLKKHRLLPEYVKRHNELVEW